MSEKLKQAQEGLNEYRNAVKVKKLGLGQTTNDGAYWAEINGVKIGDKDRCFWHTEDEAELCAFRYWMTRRNLNQTPNEKEN